MGDWAKDLDSQDDSDNAKTNEDGKSEPKKGKGRRRPRRLGDDEDEEKKMDKKAEKPKHSGKEGWGSPVGRGQAMFDDASAPGGKDEEIADEKESDGPSGSSRRRVARDIEETEVLMIPDLEEEEEEDITEQVAEAPRNVVRHVQSLQQLDHAIKFSIPSSAGLDLRVLTAALVPPEMVRDDDTLWEFDSLLQEVTQDFHAEVQRKIDDAAMILELGKQAGFEVKQPAESEENQKGTVRSRKEEKKKEEAASRELLLANDDESEEKSVSKPNKPGARVRNV